MSNEIRDSLKYTENHEWLKIDDNKAVVGITDPALNSMVVNLGELYSSKSKLSFSVQEKNPSLLALENEIQYMRASLEENLKNLISNAQIQLDNLQERKGQINYQLSQLPKTEQDLVNIKRQFDLNNELYQLLINYGYKRKKIQFILNAPKINTTPKIHNNWEDYYDDDWLSYIKEKEI